MDKLSGLRAFVKVRTSPSIYPPTRHLSSKVRLFIDFWWSGSASGTGRQTREADGLPGNDCRQLIDSPAAALAIVFSALRTHIGPEFFARTAHAKEPRHVGPASRHGHRG
jgi:hypothetical protein